MISTWQFNQLHLIFDGALLLVRGLKMAKILISSLLPIVITLLVGYFAGFKRDFAEPDAALLNKVIMKYTLL